MRSFDAAQIERQSGVDMEPKLRERYYSDILEWNLQKL